MQGVVPTEGQHLTPYLTPTAPLKDAPRPTARLVTGGKEAQLQGRESRMPTPSTFLCFSDSHSSRDCHCTKVKMLQASQQQLKKSGERQLTCNCPDDQTIRRSWQPGYCFNPFFFTIDLPKGHTLTLFPHPSLIFLFATFLISLSIFHLWLALASLLPSLATHIPFFEFDRISIVCVNPLDLWLHPIKD